MALRWSQTGASLPAVYPLPWPLSDDLRIRERRTGTFRRHVNPALACVGSFRVVEVWIESDPSFDGDLNMDLPKQNSGQCCCSVNRRAELSHPPGSRTGCATLLSRNCGLGRRQQNSLTVLGFRRVVKPISSNHVVRSRRWLRLVACRRPGVCPFWAISATGRNGNSAIGHFHPWMRLFLQRTRVWADHE